MNKERLGDFIGSERKNLGLTQRDLAARLHVTDKAVSKWERGLSYPDVTLLEPLAAALDLTVEELMACRRQAAKGAEETMQSLLDISRDSVRQERRRSWQRLVAVLVLLAVTAAVVAYTQIVVTEERIISMWSCRGRAVFCGCGVWETWTSMALPWKTSSAVRWSTIWTAAGTA